MFDLTLSFDNGPDPDVTPAVLDCLARRKIKTTFFVVGQKLADPAARACAERAHAQGHWIGNHSWTHSKPLGLEPGREAAEREIGQTQAALGGLSHPARWFRPMGGGGHLDQRLLSADAARLLQDGGYSCVLWNAVPRDWADPDGWVQTALHQVAQRRWTLMVLHDLPTGAMRHLDRFLDAVGGMGGRFQQDFPPDCTPLIGGQATAPLDPIISP